MACDNQVGVKNILLTFTDCDTDQKYGPISHELASDTLPTLRLCPYNNEALPGGYVKKIKGNSQIEVNVVRDLRIPLALYQGCAAVDIQLEYYNGLVYSAVGGGATGDESSDTHEVTLTVSFKEIDELLPAGTLQAA
jgi:hypothetical protein